MMTFSRIVNYVVLLIFFAGTIYCAPGREGHRYKKNKHVKYVIVNIEYGQVRGKSGRTIGEKRTYYSFRGIPYAEPPIGNLRFKDPVPPKKWTTIFNATYDRDECLQGATAVQGSEDCLFINVYIPRLPRSSHQLPVMVWIYGGAFVKGSSRYNISGPDYLLEQDVVFVSFNYRLGVFGFLSTGDEVAPGNIGLKDQIAALRWVKANIKHFGGNSSRVTVFGGSAGAASISYLQLSKLAEGLFQGAIMQSGSALCLWSLSRKAKQAAFAIGKELSINASTSRQLVDGLKQVNATVLQEISTEVYLRMILTENPLDGLIFAPVIEPNSETAVLTRQSHELLRTGKFTRVPTIIGYNSLEGFAELTTKLGSQVPVRLFFARYDLDQSLLVPIDMNIANTQALNEVGSIIKYHYWGSLPIALGNQETIQFASDDLFNRPIRETVRLLSQHAPVYFYVFSYEGTLVSAPNKTMKGVAHGDEIGYIFVTNLPATAEDVVVRARTVKLWTNFAKTGTPTPVLDPLLQNTVWNTTDIVSKHLLYLDIDENFDLKLNPDEEDWRFWENLYRVFGTPPYDTY